jgi:uncharacterized protein (DUF3084 family)
MAANLPSQTGTKRLGNLAPEMERLRNELNSTKESLQAIIEEREAGRQRGNPVEQRRVDHG